MAMASPSALMSTASGISGAFFPARSPASSYRLIRPYYDQRRQDESFSVERGPMSGRFVFSLFVISAVTPLPFLAYSSQCMALLFDFLSQESLEHQESTFSWVSHVPKLPCAKTGINRK